jgi:DNA-binding PadR family transcriptional regulator
MDAPFRITPPLLDVLEVLVAAAPAEELHGWAIMKATRRTGPTVYQVLDRLAREGWVQARWEERHPEPNKPRRRFYRVSPEKLAAARAVVASRRPASRPFGVAPSLGCDAT